MASINATTSSGIVATADNTGQLQLQSAGTTSATFNSFGIGLGSATPSSGIGITFPAAKSPSSNANTLDDYEEGTWTPGLTVAGASFTSAVGRYTKVGNFVYVTWELNFPSTSNTSSFEVTGLPFTVNNNNYTGNVGITNYGSADLCFFVHGGTSNIFVRNNSNVNLQLNAFSSRFVHGSAGYFIN